MENHSQDLSSNSDFMLSFRPFKSNCLLTPTVDALKASQIALQKTSPFIEPIVNNDVYTYLLEGRSCVKCSYHNKISIF